MAQLKLVVAAVFCALLLPQCSALKCYTCATCDGDEKGSVEECDYGQDVCMKLSLGGESSVKMCGYRTLCNVGDVEMALSDVAKTKIKNWVSDIFGTEEENSLPQVIHCCKTDHCNTASSSSTAMLLVVPLALGALLR